MILLDVPGFSADATDHADWLELNAIDSGLNSGSGVSSMSDLISAVTRTGSVDAMASIEDFDDDEPLDTIVGGQDDRVESLVNDAFAQLERRQHHLGTAYPFEVGDRTLQVAQHARLSPYAFLLALTHARDRTKNDGPSLFERVSRSALVEYLGGQSRVEFYDFGWPRRNGLPAFRDAVKDLCARMKEGQGVGSRVRTGRVKDAKLDVVAWLPFRDGRSNQLAVFGQCTTSNRWRDKINELQPHAFCQLWLAEQPAMSPLAAFFVPHHVSDDEWRQAAVSDRRLFFDRLRVTQFLGNLDPDLAERCAQWTSQTLDEYG